MAGSYIGLAPQQRVLGHGQQETTAGFHSLEELARHSFVFLNVFQYIEGSHHIKFRSEGIDAAPI